MRRFIKIIGLTPVILAGILLRIQIGMYDPAAGGSMVGYYILILILVGAGYLTVCFNVKDEKLDNVLENMKSYKIAYIFEAVLFGITILTFLPFIYDFLYRGSINEQALIWLILSSVFFLWYFVNLIMGSYNRPEDLFAIVSIPICMAYCFIIVPNGVPDEPAHFGKAYLVSNGVLTNEFEFTVPTAYMGFSDEAFYTYDRMLENFFARTDYQDLMVSGKLVQSSFIYYVIPALGIWLGRFLNLSLTAAYILGRMFNSFFYIVMGYLTIKKTPFGKYVFLIYMLNPVCVQQASSMSLDVVLHSFCWYAIAYILDIYQNSEAIEYRDIFILGSLMVVACLQKPNYIVLWSLIFICHKQLRTMSFAQWVLVFIFIVMVPATYYGNTLLLGEKTEAWAVWSPPRENVDASLQMRFLIEDPSRIPTILWNTWDYYGLFYLESFTGVTMSWFNLKLPEVLAYGYLAMNFTAVLFGEGEGHLTIGAKIWSLILSVLLFLSAILAMYLYWTFVGHFLIDGVQGRYFMPFAVLIPLCLVPKHKLSHAGIGQIYAFGITCLQCWAMVCLFMQYI